MVPGATPDTSLVLVDPDPDWPLQYDRLAGQIRDALGWRVLQLDHVGSTSVAGLPAEPIIDIDLTVRPAALQSACLRIRQPRAREAPDFRDWLRGNPADRDLYAAAKRRHTPCHV
jgi:GrpB-like predicted nucleotidyltransferase (UPF0157 family)